MTVRVGIGDVAKAAGVSATTVSHALSGRGKVSPATRELVRRIANDLGYAPNRMASALRSRRSDIVGFVSDEIATTPFAGRIVLGAQEAAASRGMTLMVVNSNRDAAVERHQIAVLLAHQVDALIYATMFHRQVQLPSVPSDVPLVLVNAVAPGSAVPAVAPDEHGLAMRATQVLIDAGHQHIAHLTIEDTGFGTDGRRAGYRDAMRRRGLEPHVVSVGPIDAGARAGRMSLRRALEEHPSTTAVFCFNDQMAMGVYQAAGDLGLRIPEDLSVVGVDDLKIIAGELRPGLTTLALPHSEMGRWAVLEAVARIENGSGVQGAVLLDCALVERGSVGPARRA